MFVNIVFYVSMLVRGNVSEKAASVSLMNYVLSWEVMCLRKQPLCHW